MSQDEPTFLEKVKKESQNPKQHWSGFSPEERWKTLGIALPDEDQEMMEFLAQVCGTRKGPLGRNIIRGRIKAGFPGKDLNDLRAIYKAIRDKRGFAKRVWEFLTSREEGKSNVD